MSTERIPQFNKSPVDFSYDRQKGESYIVLPSYPTLHLHGVEKTFDDGITATLVGESDEGDEVAVTILAVDGQPDIPTEVLRITIDGDVVFEVNKH